MTLDGPTMAAIALQTVQNTGGTTVSLTSWTDSYDPQTGINTRTPTTTVVVSSPLIPIGDGRSMKGLDVAARVVGTLYIPAAGTAVVPFEGMQANVSGAEYTVIAVGTITVVETSVVYVLDVAKGGEVVP